jgi:hypothetical protein
MSEPTAQQRAANDVAVTKATLANNLYIPPQGGLTGGNITGGLVPQPYPNVCPGCGRCKDCGHPYQQPYQIPYQQPTPYWGGGTGLPNMGTICVNAQNEQAAQ